MPTDEKTDYQKTLNLPKTDFAMKAGLAQKEPLTLAAWQKQDLYGKICEASKGKKTFILHDGPPYANGHIHIGHALNKTLKDIIVKFRAMQGHDSFYLPGWDCHGLPIEHQLLKDLNKRKSDVDCLSFRKKAHEYAMKFVGIQRDEFKRLGVFGAWEDPYLTLDPEYEYWILKSLAELNKKGYVYRGLKPVNWCFQCETALAEAEVEYENHTSPSVYVKFAVTNPDVLNKLPNKKLSLLIWTTTPWTLMANVAVAVHPSFRYVLVDVGEEILIMESSLAVRVLGKAGINKFNAITELTGDQLTSLTYTHPFGLKQNCRVITADYVTKEDGTGLVHTAPGHGQEDFQSGLKHKLDVLMPVDDRGVYTQEAGKYAGQHVFKANEKIIEELKGNGALFHQENLTHTYPHCWRCKKPIIFRATKQWFLKIDHDNLRERLIKVIKNDVQWIPPAGEERISAMVGLRPDWCLSRQRYWGVPIPAVKCKSCQELILSNDVIERFADIARKEGTDAWFEKDIKEFIPANLACLHCQAKDFEKTFDILDVWFDSGVSHQAVVKGKMKKETPIDMYLEGSDQHRGWFQSSIIPSVALDGHAPYRSVLTHGFVVDGQGRKMSKSLGNVVAPQEIMQKYGADILRLWIASSSYNDDIRISDEIMERLIDAYRKIRNTIRYILGNLYDFDPNRDLVKYDQLTDLDKWALYRLAATVNDVKVAYEEYSFAKVCKLLFHFCNEDLSSFYLDILKDRLYTSAAQSVPRRAAQSVLYHTLNHLIRILTPILVFTSEEIFAVMPKDKADKDKASVHLLGWLDVPAEWHQENIHKEFELLVALRPYVLKALAEKRAQGEIGSSLEAAVNFQTASQRDYDYLSQYKNLLPETFIVSQVTVEKVKEVAKGLDEQFAQTSVIIEKAKGTKCNRCWNYKEDVGQDTQHQTLCGRCAAIVKEIS